jgi:flagellar motor protein MotB
MREEKQERESAAETDLRADAPGTEGSPGAGKIAWGIEKANPAVLLLFMILLMAFVLILLGIRGGGAKDAGTGSDDPVLAMLKADVETRRAELNRQRMAMGLTPLEGGAEPIEDIAARLKEDADSLAGRAAMFQQMLGEKDAEISRTNSDVLGLEKRLKSLSRENSRLLAEMDRALVSVSEVEQLRKTAAVMRDERDMLSKELTDVRAQLAEAAGAVNAEDYADLQRRYDEALRSKDFFEDRVKQLESAPPAGDLFAESEAELLPAAVELFRRLRTLEGHKDSDLTTEYSKVGVDLGANVLHALTFETGKSELSSADMEQLAAIAATEVPDGDLTLIIGYASETGNLDANQELSSRRATAAAEHFASLKRPGQLVQAVYLGQTDRFSSRVPERNQICEVWRIRRK